MRAPARVWYLEMASAAQLRPARDPGSDIAVRRCEEPAGELNRFFYEEVGAPHHWVDRRGWPAERWQAWAQRVETWLIQLRGTPAGYGELDEKHDGTVEVAHFGVLPRFQGRGLGGHLLTVVVASAWERGPRRVTLSTCELDGRHARRNYERRGFRVVHEALESRGRAA